MKPIDITIDSEVLTLVRGEEHSIVVTLDVLKPIDIRGIHAKFHGATETKATYTIYNAASKSNQTHTAIQMEDIVLQEDLLSGQERLSFLGNVADSVTSLFGGGDYERLAIGSYDFEIQIMIPEHAPGTFEAKNCRVFYELKVQVDIPRAIDVVAEFSFQLPTVAVESKSEPVTTKYPEDMEKGLLDSWFAPDLMVESALTQNRFRRGDTIDGIFQISSAEPLRCRAIFARLVGFENTEAQKHHDILGYSGEKHTLTDGGHIEASFKQVFSIPAEVEGPASNRGALYSIDWFLEIQIDVPWAKDPKIRVPIFLLD